MQVQITFAQESLKRAIDEMGSPFSETSVDLLVLDSRNIADSAVADTMWHIERLGFDQYFMYVNKRLVNQTVPVSDPIMCNKLCLFSWPSVKEISRKQLQLESLKMTAHYFLGCTLLPKYSILAWMSSSSMKISPIHHHHHCWVSQELEQSQIDYTAWKVLLLLIVISHVLQCR